MRRLFAILISLAALNAAAQSRPKLEPIPEPPPAPPGVVGEALEPQVTITRRGEDKVEEFRKIGRASCRERVS
jgi:hypothetical protein